MYYYFVCECRCCRVRINYLIIKKVYERGIKKVNGGSVSFPNYVHECMNGAGVLEVVQLVKSKEVLI